MSRWTGRRAPRTPTPETIDEDGTCRGILREIARLRFPRDRLARRDRKIPNEPGSDRRSEPPDVPRRAGRRRIVKSAERTGRDRRDCRRAVEITERTRLRRLRCMARRRAGEITKRTRVRCVGFCLRLRFAHSYHWRREQNQHCGEQRRQHVYLGMTDHGRQAFRSLQGVCTLGGEQSQGESGRRGVPPCFSISLAV